MRQALFDAELVKRYDTAGPRYTSYPTAVEFNAEFSEAHYRHAVAASNDEPIPRPLSLYIHVPFCATLCFYCACNKVVTKNRSKAVEYLERLHREISLQAALFDGDRRVEQLHFGGGTPTFLSPEQLESVMQELNRNFPMYTGYDREFSIELDPRTVDRDYIALLYEMGFNRISLGVQDFDEAVQKAVNRIQSRAQTEAVIDAARAVGFESVSIDLIYGLPLQTRAGFSATMDKIVAIRPDRLSLFNYAHLPHRFAPQRRIREDQLPPPEDKLGILSDSVAKLMNAGYQYIGMDHFALPDDALAKAQRHSGLYRNFQGYSTHANCDLIGLGVTAIGAIGDTFSQNYSTLDDYYAAVDVGRLPIARGYELDGDDRLRGQVIQALMCHFRLHKADVENRYGIVFDDYFADELARLAPMRDDGLVALEDREIRVTAPGRFLIRNIAMVFDRYLRNKTGNHTFSKVL